MAIWARPLAPCVVSHDIESITYIIDINMAFNIIRIVQGLATQYQDNVTNMALNIIRIEQGLASLY